MTERKPPEESFPSWIDQQIIEAEKRGVFDNLPGTGKPIPATEQTDYTQAWLRDYLRREGVSTEELLPTPLKLRKESERLTAALPGLPSEQAVRDTVRTAQPAHYGLAAQLNWAAHLRAPGGRGSHDQPLGTGAVRGPGRGCRPVATDQEASDTAPAPRPTRRRPWRRVGRLRRR